MINDWKIVIVVFLIGTPIGIYLGDKMIASENADKQKCVAAGGVPVSTGRGDWICTNPAVIVRY